MFLSASQLEPSLLKRLEVLGDVPGLGLTHLALSVLQAHNSAAGLEWSSNDGHDEGAQDSVMVDLANGALLPQLEAWQSFVSPGPQVKKAQYFAAAHVLAQGVLGSILAEGEPAVQPAALNAAWQEDAGASEADSLLADRFKLTLATLATACSSDGTPQAAGACLAALLSKVQGQPDRWLGLVHQYGDTAAAAVGRKAGLQPAADSVAVVKAGYKGEGGDLGEDGADVAGGKPDVTPASDKSPDAAGTSAKASDGGGDGAEDDGASSLGLSRIASRASSASAAPTVDNSYSEVASAGPSASGGAGADAAARYTSSKSLLGPELRRQISRSLSGASSADLDALPGDLDALEQRQSANQGAAKPAGARTSLLAGLMASEEGKGHLAEMPMDIRSWANFKDKQAAAAPPGGRQRNDVVGGSLSLASGGKGALDQHLKATRAAAGGPPTLPSNPLHSGIVNGSAARQSVERERGGTVQGIVAGPAPGSGRNGGNETPVRQRSLATNSTSSSRKLSVSEPAPTCQQAEWKHLPALGQASRLHAHELRQPSRTALSRGNTGSQSPSAAALVEDKLPMLPSLAGARGAPPKAMELLRRPSQMQRSDAHHADSHRGQGAQQQYPQQGPRPLVPGSKGQLPGLGGGRGPGMPPPGSRAIPLLVKKSFRGDRDF